MPWIAGVSLQEVCLLSWVVGERVFEGRLPAGVELDRYNGDLYATAVVLWNREARLRGIPPIPGRNSYPQLNLRTYVTYRGEPGIWWLRVDATPGGAAPWLARQLFHAPYTRCRIRYRNESEWRTFTTFPVSDAARESAPTFKLKYQVDKTSEPRVPPRDSLEHFVCERDIAYSFRFGRVWRFKVVHPPWRIQPVECVELDADAWFDSCRLPRFSQPPLGLYAPRSDGLMYLPVPVSRRSRVHG